MTLPTNGTSDLDGWIREHSFRVAYSDATKGFIGKKALREVLCSSVPSELGYTTEQVRARLTTMLANDLMSDLLHECDTRRITSAGVVATTLGSGSAVVPAEGRRDRDAELGVGPSSSSRVLDKGKQRAVDPVDLTERSKEQERLTALAPGSGRRKAAVSTGPGASLVGSRGGKVTKAAGGGLAAKLAARLSGLGSAAATAGGGGSGLGAAGWYKKTGGNEYASVEESVESATTILRSSSLVSTSVNHSVRAPTSEYDVPIPFKLQYRIFTALQAILEGCCFSFAEKNYPAYLARKAWDCPEAGELPAWTRGLIKEFCANPVFDMSEDEFEVILKNANDIRKTAVHRVPVSAEEIQRLIGDAWAMALLLDDEDRKNEIEEIKTVVEKNIQALLEKRHTKEEKLRLKLEELENLKRDIELRETLALEGAENEEEALTRSFQEDIARELEWLGLEGKGIGVRDRARQEDNDGEDGGVTDKEGGDGDGPLLTIAEHEEAFHEPEGWPAGEGFTAEELAAAAESISNLSA